MDNENIEEDKIKKYPKSKNKLQCMGPCYEPYTWITHPITLEYITNDVPFCTVNDKLYDKKTGKQELIKTDECYNPIKNNNSVINNDVLIPYIDLDCGLFLRKYYGIYTHEELVDWLIKNNNKT